MCVEDAITLLRGNRRFIVKYITFCLLRGRWLKSRSKFLKNVFGFTILFGLTNKLACEATIAEQDYVSSNLGYDWYGRRLVLWINGVLSSFLAAEEYSLTQAMSFNRHSVNMHFGNFDIIVSKIIELCY